MSSYAINRIKPSELLNAVSLVRKGKIYDLGSNLSNKMPEGSKETFHGFSLSQYHIPNALMDQGHKGFDFSMDVITCCPHLGTHIDALIHVQDSGMIFGGGHIKDAFGVDGWKKYGMETVPPIVGRGVLVDMAAYYDVGIIADGFEITQHDLAAALKQQGTKIKNGDVVLVRTGKYLEYLRGDENYFNKQPGVGPSGAVWLYEQGMAVLGSDTTSTEPSPFPNLMHTTHCAMLVERGVHIIEIMDLDEISKDKVYEFLFIALPLKIVGATGSWLRPVAII